MPFWLTCCRSDCTACRRFGMSPILTVALLACRRFDHTPHQILGESLNPVYTIQPVLIPVEQPLECCIHDTTGCPSGCQTGLAVCQPVGQPVVSCITNIQPVVQSVISIQQLFDSCNPICSLLFNRFDRHPVAACKWGLTFLAVKSYLNFKK